MSTYESAHKRYYWKNKELIAERRKEYRTEYNKLYYEKNKDRLNQLRKLNKKKKRLRDKDKQIAKELKKTTQNVLKAVEST